MYALFEWVHSCCLLSAVVGSSHNTIKLLLAILCPLSLLTSFPLGQRLFVPVHETLERGTRLSVPGRRSIGHYLPDLMGNDPDL